MTALIVGKQQDGNLDTDASSIKVSFVKDTRRNEHPSKSESYFPGLSQNQRGWFVEHHIKNRTGVELFNTVVTVINEMKIGMRDKVEDEPYEIEKIPEGEKVILASVIGCSPLVGGVILGKDTVIDDGKVPVGSLRVGIRSIVQLELGTVLVIPRGTGVTWGSSKISTEHETMESCTVLVSE